MDKFFSKTRIKFSEIVNDIQEFLKQVYKQNNLIFTSASPYGQLLNVMARLFQMNLFYIEDSITELNINTAARPTSIYGLSRLAGHNPVRANAASGVAALIYNNTSVENKTIIIPNFLKLRCKNNNLPYVGILSKNEIRTSFSDLNNKKITFKIYQGNFETQFFTGTGQGFQTFEVNTKESQWIDNFLVNIYVNGELFRKVDSIYDMTFNEKACVIKTGITSGIDVIFGNGAFGYVPELGSEIIVEYLLTDGYIGNIINFENAKFEFEDFAYDSDGYEINLNEFFDLKLITPVVFGANPEDIDLTKLLTPTTSRSYVLAQTSNYENFLLQMNYFNYIKVYTKFKKDDLILDNVVFLMLIPNIEKRILSSENYFTIDKSSFKLDDYEKYLLYKKIEESGMKIFGVIPYIIDPEFKKYGINIFLTILKGYDEEKIKLNIINKISDYLIKFSRKDYLPKSDIISLIENIEGVDSVDIDFISEDIEKLLFCIFNYNKIEKNQEYYNFLKSILTEDEIYILDILFEKNFDYSTSLFEKYAYTLDNNELILKLRDDINLNNNFDIDYDYNIVKFENFKNHKLFDFLLTSFAMTYDDVLNINFIIPENKEIFLKELENLINNFSEETKLHAIKQKFFKLRISYRNATLDDWVFILSNLDSVRKFISKYIDENGNIILNENEYPLFRGDWINRFGYFIEDKNILTDGLSPINIKILRKNEFLEREKINKNNLNIIKYE